jgi:hypothetical protein
MLARMLAIALTLTSAAAFAQSPPKTAAPIAPKAEQQQSSACAHADTQATVGQGGDVKVPTPEGKPLGDKLAQSNGVICPPDAIDPAIHAPTPQQGKMPVIPPPGTPGSSDQSVQPK